MAKQGIIGVKEGLIIASAFSKRLKIIQNDKYKEEKDVLCFTTTNYLGLSANKDVIEAGKKALDKYGAGTCNSRVLYGTQSPHKMLEAKIAGFHRKEDAIVFNSGMSANVSLFSPLLSAEDMVFSDELNHASLIDGIRLCKAKKTIFKHNDMQDLEDKLYQNKGCRKRLIITEGTFGMHGDVAPISDIFAIAKHHDALLAIDESHSMGTLGSEGRGAEEHFGLLGEKQILLTSSLGKAVGVSGPTRVAIYSIGLPPTVASAAAQALSIIMESPELMKTLQEKAKYFRKLALEAGFMVAGNEEQNICPILFGNPRDADTICGKLLEKNILVAGVCYPLIRKDDLPRIRFTIMSEHEYEDIDYVIDSLCEITDTLNILKNNFGSVTSGSD